MSPQTTKRLVGWKEIATHAQTSVRTAQRWERGLPVHRLAVLVSLLFGIVAPTSRMPKSPSM